MDEPTIIDHVFNKNNSINVDKQVIEKRITFTTTNGTLENNQTVVKIISELRARQRWHQMKSPPYSSTTKNQHSDRSPSN